MAETIQTTGRPPRVFDVFTARGVRDPQILAAMRAVRRDHFPTSDGVPPPDAIGRVIDAMEIGPADRVLKVAAGSGWTSAVLGRLAAEVWTSESNREVAEAVRQHLEAHGGSNVHVLAGDWDAPEVKAKAPFDAILLSGPVEAVPEGLVDCLGSGGRLVAVLAAKNGKRRLRRVRIGRDGKRLSDDLGESRAVPLLGDLLVASQRVPRDVLEAASVAARERGVSLGDELLARGACEESDLYRALAKQAELPFADASQVLSELDPELVRRFQRSFLDHHKVVPIKEKNGEILVATSDAGIAAWEAAQAFDVKRVAIRVVTPTDYRRIWRAIDLGHVGANREPVTEEMPVDADLADQSEGETTRVSSTLDAIVHDAVAERASDLHFEFYDGRLRIRFRVDGNLRDVTRYDLGTRDMAALVNLIKIASKLDIAERRLPQGGRMRKRFGDRVYDMRVQTQPALHGEHVVIRLLPKEARIPAIEELGFPEVVADRYRRFLRSPHGMVLVVGPTGSGKSTTLYAGIRLLAEDVSRKIITVEDPIENTIHRVQQTQVNTAIGWGFSDAMRAFVREDPDVILVGEIRDAETALEAIRAAQTGHLVLSTLHCNDAVDAVQRLLDLGMHPNSIGSELSAVFSQRLARRVCVNCRVPAKPDPVILGEIFPGGLPAEFRCFAGPGCDHCGGHGTRGRVAVVEFLAVSPAIRKAVSRRESLDDLRELAHKAGLISLRDSCLRLVQEGVIPVTEIPDVLTAEQMHPPDAAG
jgi:type IV pilus assembly protein PilB